jgi:hypothetical protein
VDTQQPVRVLDHMHKETSLVSTRNVIEGTMLVTLYSIAKTLKSNMGLRALVYIAVILGHFTLAQHPRATLISISAPKPDWTLSTAFLMTPSNLSALSTIDVNNSTPAAALAIPP